MVVSNRRMIAKAFTWRAIAVSITAIVSYVITGEAKISMLIGGIDSLVKLIGYYLHERVWEGIGQSS